MERRRRREARQFLLDMAEYTGETRYRDHADALASILCARVSVYEGLRLTCEPTMGADYASGSAGVLDFLLRLRHGGPRLWMPER